MLRVASLLMLAIMLHACGNKGPLYLPSNGQQTGKPPAPDSVQQAPRQ